MTTTPMGTMPAATLCKRLLLALLATLTALLALSVPAQAAEEEPFAIEPGSFTTAISTSQAGAHPDLRTTFKLNLKPNFTPNGGAVRNLNLVLPKGLIGSPTATPTCSISEIVAYACPLSAAVGRVTASSTVTPFVPPLEQEVLVYNINPYPGEPAAFGFVAFYPIRIDTHLRADGDYGVTVTSTNLTEGAQIIAADLTLWGVPADHNGPGPETDDNSQRHYGGPSGEPRIPFITNPTECTGQPFLSTISFETWQVPVQTATADYALPRIQGCEKLEFEPAISALPTTDLADAPSGLDFNLHLPQHNSFVGNDEVQTLSVLATEGQFKLGLGAESTGATGTGDTELFSTTVSNLVPSNGTFAVGEGISGPGILPGTTIAAVAGGTITLSQIAVATESNVPLAADLDYNAGAPAVQSALEALTEIGAGNVTVNGGPGDELGSNPYKIVFGGALAHQDVAQITSADGAVTLQITNGSGTSPGSATVSTTLPGTPGGSPAAELATAQLRDALVTLPAGMTVNPSSANGLAACSLAQAGISASGQSNGLPSNCPDASKLGTVEAVSPALDHPLPGSLYLAAPNENPFGSLLALYLDIEDPRSGINAKLPGRVEPDPQSGELTVSFRDNPQLPLEDLSLHLFSGPRAALKTPSACAVHTTTSTLTPWTSPQGKDATPTSSFALTKGPDGGACLPDGAAAPNSPTFSAGTLNPTAKAFSPFVLKLRRADGTQPFKSIDTTLPKGLVAKLAGVPYCPDAALAAAANRSGKAELASPSCPAASQVGAVDGGVGAGSDPFYASGKAYLAGPYKGAPLSLAVVTPAVAGPFDLGTVVVRTALAIDPVSAQVHALSDPFPTILQGIPLDIRSVTISLDKPDFTLNPTNCNPSAVLGGLTSVFDQTAPLSDPFQVGDCARLKFGPSLKVSLKGQTKRTGNPAITAVLKAPEGQANLAKTAVLLPRTEFIDNAHINSPCTRVQFNAGACPAKSILGTATAYTPLLDKPLTGPVYFRSNGGERELPDMVVDLGGQIHVTLVGFIDSVPIKGTESARVRTRFQSVPDAPVSKFVLKLYGGKRGLISNSVNICRHPANATVQMEAQNGNLNNFDTPFAARCGKKHKGQTKAKHQGAKHRRAG